MQAAEQQDSADNILSPEAKEFVPRQLTSNLDGGDNGLGPGQEGGQFGFYEGLQYPGDVGKIRGQHPVGGLPSYMTTCYPFVPSGEPRYGLRPRGRGKYNNNPHMFVPQQFSPIQPGLTRNRFPHPGKGHMQGWNGPPLTDMYQPFSNIPNGMPFDGGTYQNGFIRPNLQHVPPVPDSKPVKSPRETYPDTYTTNAGDASKMNGYEPKKQWNVPRDEPSLRKGKPSSNYKTVPANKPDKTPVKTKTNMKTQTDFPENLANATLEDIPNSLFQKPRKFSSTKARHKAHRRDTDTQSSMHSDSDENLDGEGKYPHSSILHRKNQVSNGTNPPATIGVAIGNANNVSMTTTHGNNQYTLSYKEIVTGNHHSGNKTENSNNCNTVPSSSSASFPVMFSYASVARGLPSHKNINSNKAGLASVVTKSDKETCDSSSGKVAVVKSNNMNSGFSNVNVAQIMEDLEKAGSLTAQDGGANVNTVSMPSLQSVATSVDSSMVVSNDQIDLVSSPVYTWGQGQNAHSSYTINSQGDRVMSYSNIVKQIVPERGALSTVHNNSQASGSDIQEVSHSVHTMSRSHMTMKVQGHNNDPNASESQKMVTGEAVQNLHFENEEAPATDNQDETGAKKKRRRRRRRKKKSGDAEAVSDDANSGANDEVMLHFEDDEEFPDLGGNAGSDPNQSQAASFSYSDILKTTGSSSRSASNSVQDNVLSTEEHGSDSIGTSPKETRNSRKRRKRRETANKAADAEMAEINLEQHMLELKMKQKHPLSAAKKSASPVRKSVSPVRTSPVQSIWKLPPSNTPSSQPSSTGKKVSLLLPGTVAPDNLSASRQPNPGAKQYSGILKTTQSQSTPIQQAPNLGTSGGGGGKKSKQPITYDLGALIDALEEKKNQPPPPKREVRPVINRRDEVRSANMLDASAPMKRGKERETPKIKKPSPLKKVILKEREEKKRLRMLDEDDTTSGAPVGIGVVSGESDLSQDASSSKGSMEVGLGTPLSAELSPISQPSPSCISPMSPGASPISSGVNSPLTGSTQQFVKLKIHSRRFREYCNQVLDKEIDNCVIALLTDLVRFQDKQYHKDPIKAKAKRRFVLGLREVTKHLRLRKIKCVVISPNLEKIQSKGGLDDALNNILELCNEQSVPFVFALGRRALGRACAKLVPVSVVGVFNYEGSEENFKSLVNLTEKARDSYKEMIGQIEKEIAEQPPRAHVPGVPHIFAHMGHSRTPSGCSVISFTSSILSEPISENYPYSEPETDNRGYEIEKGGSGDTNLHCDESKTKSVRNAQDKSSKETFEKDPYEADDESGRVKKSPNKPSSSNNNDVSAGKHISSDSSHGIMGETTASINTEQRQTDSNTTKPSNQGEDGMDDCDEDADSLGLVSDPEDDDIDDDAVDDEDDFEEELSDEDHEQSHEDCDTIQDLPYIDSVHHFDLHEILSTHSSKTLENGEDVLSTHSSKTTHSSRTPGDSSTLAGDNKGCKIKIDIKHGETTSTLSLKGKTCLDKENRTLTWVKEAQTLHFNDEIECNSEGEETTIDVVGGVALECLDAVA